MLKNILVKLAGRERGGSIDPIRARVNDALAKQPQNSTLLPDFNL